MKNRKRGARIIVLILVAAYVATWANARLVIDPAIREVVLRDIESNGIQRIPEGARAEVLDNLKTLINSEKFDPRIKWVVPIIPGVVLASSDYLIRPRDDSPRGYGCSVLTTCTAYGVGAKCFFIHTSGCAP